MAVAAFVLAVIGVLTGAASLTWNVVSFLWQGARPKLTPIVGFVSVGGLVHADASRDMRESLSSAFEQFQFPFPLVVGVKVINAGRASFHVAGWTLRSEPGAVSLSQFDVMPGSGVVGCDIAPGASAMFYTKLNDAFALASAAKTIDGKPQRVVVTVESGGRVYRTKPIAPVNVELGAPVRPPG
jgi:hypothetical protein